MSRVGLPRFRGLSATRHHGFLAAFLSGGASTTFPDILLRILEIKTRTMTDMYREPRVSEAKLTAYPHEERGQEVRRWVRRKRTESDASVGRVVLLLSS